MAANKILLWLWLLLLTPVDAVAEWYRQDAAIMGTAIAVELWHEDEAKGRALTQAVMNEMRRIDERSIRCPIPRR